MPDRKLQIGDHVMQATGNIELASKGERTSIAANGMLGALLMSAAKQVGLQCGSGMLTMENAAPGAANLTFQTGPAGSITIGLGPVELGARIILKPGELEIAVGPAAGGSSIKMTPVSIQMQVAENSYEITPLGTSESVAEVTTRSATPAGHELKAAESSYQLSPAGEAVNAPTSSRKLMTASEVQAGATASEMAAGEGSLKAAMVMIN